MQNTYFIPGNRWRVKQWYTNLSGFDFYGYGCCRYDGWGYHKNHGDKTKEECIDICVEKSDCIAIALSRPNGNKNCDTFYGSGDNFRTECDTTNKDELCYKKSGLNSSVSNKFSHACFNTIFTY